MLNEKATTSLLIVGLIKKILLYKMSYFLEPYTPGKNKMKFKLDFSTYAAKSDLKNTTGVNQILLKNLI